jgi:L-lysine exporter family protein LysE/ArgO
MPAADTAAPLGRVIATCLLLTWANPHVYLDTLVLLGAISSQYAPHGLAFGIGAATASLVFFATLGFGARLLAPVFARPQAWVILEVVVGATMWAIAASLILS